MLSKTQKPHMSAEERHKKFCDSLSGILSKLQTELNENPDKLINVPMEDFTKRMSSMSPSYTHKPHPFIVLEIKRCILDTNMDIDIGSVVISKRLNTQQYKKKLAEQKTEHEKHLSLYSHEYQ